MPTDLRSPIVWYPPGAVPLNITIWAAVHATNVGVGTVERSPQD